MNGFQIDNNTVSQQQHNSNLNGSNFTEGFVGGSVTPSPPTSSSNSTAFLSTNTGNNNNSNQQFSQSSNNFLGSKASNNFNKSNNTNFGINYSQQQQQQQSNLFAAMDNDLVATVRLNLAKLEELRKEIEAQAKQISVGNYNIASIKSIGDFMGGNINGVGMGGIGLRDMGQLSSGGNNFKNGVNSNFPPGAFNMRNGHVPGIGMNFNGNMLSNPSGMMPPGMNFLPGQPNGVMGANGGVNMGNTIPNGDDPNSPNRNNNSRLRVSFSKNLINAPEASASSREGFMKRNGRRIEDGFDGAEASASQRDNFMKRNGRRIDLNWHSEDHLPLRREVVKFIAQLLAARKLNPTRKWLSELPYKARKLEERLYRTADSIEDYLNKKTLKERLKKVATEITLKYEKAKRQTSQDKLNKPNGDTLDIFSNNPAQPTPGPNSNSPTESMPLQVQLNNFRRSSSSGFPMPNNANAQNPQGPQRSSSLGANNNDPNSNNLQEQQMSMRTQQIMSALWSQNFNQAIQHNNGGNDNNKQQQLLLQQQQLFQQQQLLMQAHQNRVSNPNNIPNLPNPVETGATNVSANQRPGSASGAGNMNPNKNSTQAMQQQINALFNPNQRNPSSNVSNNSNDSLPIIEDTDFSFPAESDSTELIDVDPSFDW